MDDHTTDHTATGAPDSRVGDHLDTTVRKVVITDGEGKVIGTTEMLESLDDPTIIYVTVTEMHQPPVTIQLEVDGAAGPEPDTVFVSCAERDVARV